MKVTIEIIGWISAVMLLSCGHCSRNARKVSANSRLYTVACHQPVGRRPHYQQRGWNSAYPSAAINVVWMLIAIFGVAARHGRESGWRAIDGTRRATAISSSRFRKSPDGKARGCCDGTRAWPPIAWRSMWMGWIASAQRRRN